MTDTLVLGLNQYTHSAAACLLGPDGEVRGALAKERVTRRKHDGGDVAVLVETLLAQTGHALDEIGLVVANNHLFRIRPFEASLPFACALHQQPPSALRDTNLFPGIAKHELSHHLAHAWSVLPLAPFERGLIVVADGIGSTRADVDRASVGSELGPYTSDRDLPQAADFAEFPAAAPPHSTAREAESVYRFAGLRLEALWKRWAQERSPVFLYNTGFENMESLGAVYSRVSSHLFGDWNACGKVMGLAPWAQRWAAHDPGPLLRGPLAELEVDHAPLAGVPRPHEWAAVRDEEDLELRAHYLGLAARVQRDLEDTLLAFLSELRERTGERALCLVGGVALNSTANGRIAREAGFEQVFIPPWPGDEGVAIGCALFGHHQRHAAAPARRRCFSPYLGGTSDPASWEEAWERYGPWLILDELDQAGVAPAPEQQDAAWLEAAAPRVAQAAAALAAGEVLAWFQGRSEFGPRALGNRSILATPAEAGMVERINAAIKKREAFRPFAPTVLAEDADQWFEGVTPSPAMSLTVTVRPEQAAAIPAVVHVDGSARIQTLDEQANPLYRRLVASFAGATGLPLVLNTSFNVRGEPIVETPDDALRHFLDSELDLLILDGRALRKRPFPAAGELGAAHPQALAEFTAEAVSDASGETVAVHLLARGDTRESDQLELGVLEACDGSQSVAALEADFASEFELPPEEFRAALARLYEARLLHFGSC